MQDDHIKCAAYCWARVEESERMAAAASDPQNKAILRELASRWRRLALESDGAAFKPVGGSRPRLTKT